MPSPKKRTATSKKKYSYKILFATSEVYPLIKTGGLADVSSGLPIALHNAGHDVAIIVPGYPSVIAKTENLQIVRPIPQWRGQLYRGTLPNTEVPVWIVDIPELFNRTGGPYQDTNSHDWPDNAERFFAFCQVAAELAMNRLDLAWKPDVVHSNDWQTGLISALLSRESARPATIFTIHNMAYQGVFSWETFQKLGLPAAWWSMDYLEYYDRFSFLKGGIVFSDRVNTVSPTYADEIRTPQFGFGMEGLLNHRAHVLSGILNGVDTEQWNPAKDEHIARPFSARSLPRKVINKKALQTKMGLPVADRAPLLGAVGRMIEQKGYDLILETLPRLMQHDVQIVILGSGDKRIESALAAAQKQYPGKCAIQIGYDESLAHLIEAGADMFLMPSRFEPCGLNQIYSLRYGTVPIVHNTGGLADSVVDATDENIENGIATGFKFYEPNHPSLYHAIERALTLYHQPQKWTSIIKTAMKQDYSWEHSAAQYLDLYRQAFQTHKP